MAFPAAKEIQNEADVEHLVVLPLLHEVLQFLPEELKPKDYLAPSDIDKGAGKITGYFPDFVIYLGGVPVLVVEAKAPDVPVENGYREARLYAAELNKQFPKDINPVKYVCATNGQSILYGPWDSEADAVQIKLSDCLPGNAKWEVLVATLIRASLLKVTEESLAKLQPRHWYKPLQILGSPSRQHATIAPNEFAAELAPLLRRYFDPDETIHSDEVIRRGYCSSDELTKYNATLESLLKDRMPHRDEFSEVVTTKNRAAGVDQALNKAISNKPDVSDPLILVVGAVGAGKSFFIERYIRHLASPEIQKNTFWSVIDFNQAPDSLGNIEAWICDSFLKSFAERNNIPTLKEYENLRHYFAPDIAERERGAYKPLKQASELEYAKALSADLKNWSEDSTVLCKGVIRYYAKDKGKPVIAVFDNVDRRSRDDQLRIFQAVQWFRHAFKCFAVLALRDETYDAYSDQPPLDAFLKPFAFRITAPRFINVVRKRLELAIEWLTHSAEKTQQYTLPNGATVTYPTTRLGSYLLNIYVSVFHPERQMRLMLEALSGRNTRKALEMFTDILVSGYFREDTLFKITQGRLKNIPEWLVIRVLMRTNHEFYSDTHGYIQNIFSFPENGRSGNNFMMIQVLEYLARNRKNKSGFKIEGYLRVRDVITNLAEFGYLREDLIWGLESLLAKELIMADHQRTYGLDIDDYVKITASGLYHARFLPTRLEYAANVAIDTFFRDKAVAEEIAKHAMDSLRHMNIRSTALRDYLLREHQLCAEHLPAFRYDGNPSKRIIEHLQKGIAFLTSQERGTGAQDDMFTIDE